MDLKTIRTGELRSNGGEMRREAATRARTEAEKARTEAGEQSEQLRHRLGESMFDLVTEYFPEEYQARRREDLARAFGAGLVVGFVGHELLRRR